MILNVPVKEFLQSTNTEINKKLNEITPILNLYLSLFKYSDMPVEMVFLNIVQALETFHARFICDDKDDFEKSINDRFNTNPNLEEIKNLLWSTTQKDPNLNYLLLFTRLNDLLIDNDYGGLFQCFYIVDKDFSQRVIDTRHYYTHYGKNKENKALKNDELLDAIYVLTVLLEYHICKLFGIDKTQKIKEFIDRYWARKLLAKKT